MKTFMLFFYILSIYCNFTNKIEGSGSIRKRFWKCFSRKHEHFSLGEKKRILKYSAKLNIRLLNSKQLSNFIIIIILFLGILDSIVKFNKLFLFICFTSLKYLRT